MSKQDRNPFSIILLGDPGAGKATQASYLVKKYGLYDFDMGKELTLARSDKKIDAILKKNYDVGKLAPTAVVRQIIRQKIFDLPRTQGILFDGTPKMLGEAKLIHRWLNSTGRTNIVFFYLAVPTTVTIERVIKRKGYSVGNQFKKRRMDTILALRNRAAYYRKNVKQVVEFFQKHYKFDRISGIGTRQEVRARIQKVINSHLEQLEQVHKNSPGNTTHRRRR
jgi:adenylate kinase